MNHRTGIAAIVVTAVAFFVGTTGAIAASAAPSLGMSSTVTAHAYTGYYDHHQDTFLALNASTKAAATTLHLTFAPALAKTQAAPPIYLFQGAAAAGQIPVFGLTEPGKAGYTPLWEEMIVTWKAGVTPTLFKVDDDINAAAKAGKLTVRDAHVVVDAPILTVGH